MNRMAGFHVVKGFFSKTCASQFTLVPTFFLDDGMMSVDK